MGAAVGAGAGAGIVHIVVGLGTPFPTLGPLATGTEVAAGWAQGLLWSCWFLWPVSAMDLGMVHFWVYSEQGLREMPLGSYSQALECTVMSLAAASVFVDPVKRLLFVEKRPLSP